MPENWKPIGQLADDVSRDAFIERTRASLNDVIWRGQYELAEELHGKLLDAETRRWLDGMGRDR